MAADSQIIRFVDALAYFVQKSTEGHDALDVPQVSHYTGDLDAHDLAATGTSLVFVNTLFNCLATVSDTHSFIPIWRPKFISRLAGEDRCHLNGLALHEGQPICVTAVAESDTFDGWRDHRHDSGIVINADTSEIVGSGLSMPHSPRWRDGRLWLHNSGSGDFGWVDLTSGRFQPLCFCPGYLRGLDFVANFAVIGLSKRRQSKTLSGLTLDAELAKRKVEARCGIYVVDLGTGDIAHSLTFEGAVSELYDVVCLRDRLQPAAIGLHGPEMKRMISIGSPKQPQFSFASKKIH